MSVWNGKVLLIGCNQWRWRRKRMCYAICLGKGDTVYYHLDWILKNTTNHVQFHQAHGSNTGSSKSNVEVKFNNLLSKYQTCFCSVKMLEFNCLKQIFLSKLFIYVQIIVFVISSYMKQVTSVSGKFLLTIWR